MSQERICPKCKTLPHNWDTETWTEHTHGHNVLKWVAVCKCPIPRFSTGCTDLADAVYAWNDECDERARQLEKRKDKYEQALREVDEWRHKAKKILTSPDHSSLLQELKNILKVLWE